MERKVKSNENSEQKWRGRDLECILSQLHIPPHRVESVFPEIATSYKTILQERSPLFAYQHAQDKEERKTIISKALEQNSSFGASFLRHTLKNPSERDEDVEELVFEQSDPLSLLQPLLQEDQQNENTIRRLMRGIVKDPIGTAFGGQFIFDARVPCEYKNIFGEENLARLIELQQTEHIHTLFRLEATLLSNAIRAFVETENNQGLYEVMCYITSKAPMPTKLNLVENKALRRDLNYMVGRCFAPSAFNIRTHGDLDEHYELAIAGLEKSGDVKGLRTLAHHIQHTHTDLYERILEKIGVEGGPCPLGRELLEQDTFHAEHILKEAKDIEALTHQALQYLSQGEVTRTRMLLEDIDDGKHLLDVVRKYIESIATNEQYEEAPINTPLIADILSKFNDCEGLEQLVHLAEKRERYPDAFVALSSLFNITHDPEPLKRFGRSISKRDPCTAYCAFALSHDEEGMSSTRQHYVQKNPLHAYKYCHLLGDEEGVNISREIMYGEIERTFCENAMNSPSEELKVFESVAIAHEDYLALRFLLQRDLLTRVDKAYPVFYQKGTPEEKRSIRQKIMHTYDFPFAYTLFEEGCDEQGKEEVLDYISQKTGAQKDKLRELICSQKECTGG
ncbi:hypothetical protein D6774_03715 [Candidatus Woesearchaeota archaeon]|nr:MAG: hypothetical protein D6774_03715 [Candidatus Woesearchaeota archaeon]